MSGLKSKNVVILGATGDVGMAITRKFVGEGARTLAVGRRRSKLDAAVKELPGLEILDTDVTAETAPALVIGTLVPDVLVVCAGAHPPTVPLHEMTWDEFSRNWESDVKMSFQFCKAALKRPLAAGSIVILISSGAALGGSPISGGYAGAKRMQMFMANYSQKESNRLQLGVRFVCLAPAMIMPGTALGQLAVEGYSRYLGVPAADFARGMKAPQTPDDVAQAVLEFAREPGGRSENTFTVSTEGIAAVA